MKSTSFKYIFVLLCALLIVSCSNPALVVIDPASETYFNWQGQSRDQFAAAASRAGYRLVPIVLKLTEPFSSQIDAAWRNEGKKGAVLVFPPLLEPEAIASAPHFAGTPILLLSSSSGTTPDGVQRLEVHRLEAFARLGAIAGFWSTQHANSRVHILFLIDSEGRKAELETLKGAFVQGGGKSEQLILQTWEQAPQSDGLRSAADALIPDEGSMLLLYIGKQNSEFVQLLENWKDGLFASEQVGALAINIPNLFASIDVRWDGALENMLSQAKSPHDDSHTFTAVDAVLSFYQSKLR